MTAIKSDGLKHNPDFEQIVRTQVGTEIKSILCAWQADLNLSKNDKRRFTHDFDADYFAIMSKINKKLNIDADGSLNDSFMALTKAIDYNIAKIVDEQNGRLPIETFKVEYGVLSCTMVNTQRWGKTAEKALNSDTVLAHFDGDYVVMRDRLDDTDNLRIMLTRDLDGESHFYIRVGEGTPAEKQEAMDVRTPSELHFMNEAVKLLSVFLDDREDK